MKKKFLSLLMAGVMVAGTTITANAQTDTVSGGIDETLSSNVTVTGRVTTKDGATESGKLIVEVPTTMTFAVNQAGDFTGGNYTISNKSAGDISVFVGSFDEENPQGGLTLNEHKVSSTDMDDKDRSNVQLALKGNTGAYIDLANVDATKELSRIKANDADSIQLLGRAGKAESTDKTNGVDAKGATEKFNLVFKIKKA